MMSAPSSVLLLGWNDTGAAATPRLAGLIQGLASQASVAVLLPWPAPELATPDTPVTAVASLTAADLPTAAQPQRPAGWQHPAAPYAGADAAAGAAAQPTAATGFNVPAAPYLGSTPVAAPGSGLAAALLADGLLASAVPAAETAAPSEAEAAPPTLLNQDEFASTAEPDTTEAHDLMQPETDLTPDAAPAASAAPLPPMPAALATPPAELLPGANLNRQVIHYARLATRRAQLEEFGVIYATEWPTWLAAMEIRQQTGRPLALHVHSLAQDRPTPADRGWAQELERLALRRADLVLAASEAVAQRLQSTYLLPAHRLQVAAPSDVRAVRTALRQLELLFTGR